MSTSTRESTAAPASSVLQTQATNAISRKRQLSEDDGGSSICPGNKKRKRAANLEATSSVVAATSVSRSSPPSNAVSTSFLDTASNRKDKDKKKRKKKKRKMSIVTNPEFEDERAKHKHNSSTSGGASTSFASTTALGSQDSGLVQSETKDLSDIESTVALPNNFDKKRSKEKACPVPPSPLERSPPMSRGRSPPLDTAVQEQIDNMEQQLEAQAQLLKKHQTHIAVVQQSLTCQICLDLLYKPFALAPCGHTACYDCLVRWFTTDQHDAGPNNGIGNHIYKRKTCPICRSLVFERPVEVWGIKDMVNALIKSQLVDVIPSASAEEALALTNGMQASGGSTKAGADPWHKIFRPARENHGNHDDPWWHDLDGDSDDAPDRVEGELEEVGMYDAEDHVHRCLDCMHEIWYGRCSNCNRVYPGHPEVGNDDDNEDDDDDDEDDDDDGDGDDDDDTSDSDEMEFGDDYSEEEMSGYALTLGAILDRIHGSEEAEIEGDEEEAFFTGEEGADWVDEAVYGPVIWHDAYEEEPRFAHIEEINDDGEQGVDEDGYESSFIDDNREEERGNAIVEIVGSSEDEEAEDTRNRARRMGRTVRIGGQRGRGMRRVVMSDEEGEGRRQAARRRRSG